MNGLTLKIVLEDEEDLFDINDINEMIKDKKLYFKGEIVTDFDDILASVNFSDGNKLHILSVSLKCKVLPLSGIAYNGTTDPCYLYIYTLD